MKSDPPETLPEEPKPVSRAAEWELADLVDFEFFLEQDRDEEASRLESRDHRIFQERIHPHAGQSEDRMLSDRRWLFRQWLEARRAEMGAESPLPGIVMESGWKVFLKLISLSGLLLGAGVAAELLRYDGAQPVNVAAFLGWLVLAQIALIAVAGLVVIFRRSAWLSTEVSFMTGAARWLWLRLAWWLQRHAWARVSGEKRAHLQAFLGTLGGKQQLYGNAILWPLMGALQWFGVCFNLGALGATLALIFFSDRAFGWQSAANISSDQVHALVRTLAMPWSSLVPQAGAPALEQIEGTRIILKDGIKQLATENLVSWWPFLCMALFAYGFLPRALLWTATLFLARRAVKRISFQQVACDRLYERLTAPSLETSGLGIERARQPLPPEPAQPVLTPPPARGAILPASSALALMSEDLQEMLDAVEFRRLARERFGLELHKVLPWPAESESCQAILNELAACRWRDETPKLIWLEEAWQPPIAEKLQAFQSARRVLRERAKIWIALVGRPAGGQLFTPVKAADWKVWDWQIRALGDSQLRLEALIRRE